MGNKLSQSRNGRPQEQKSGPQKSQPQLVQQKSQPQLVQQKSQPQLQTSPQIRRHSQTHAHSQSRRSSDTDARVRSTPTDPSVRNRKVSDSQLSMRAALENMSPADMLPRKYSRDGETHHRGPAALLAINPDHISDVFCQDEEIQVYIYEVYDGDTVHFLMLSAGNEGTVIKLSLRIIGIDTPEIRGGGDHLAEEKIAAELSRNRLAELVNARVSKDPKIARPRKQSLVTIIIHDWDKYGGRVLGEIILSDGRSAAEVMIAEGYGRRYNGEKKIPWTMEELSRPPFNLVI